MAFSKLGLTLVGTSFTAGLMASLLLVWMGMDKPDKHGLRVALIVISSIVLVGSLMAFSVHFHFLISHKINRTLGIGMLVVYLYFMFVAGSVLFLTSCWDRIKDDTFDKYYRDGAFTIVGISLASLLFGLYLLVREYGRESGRKESTTKALTQTRGIKQTVSAPIQGRLRVETGTGYTYYLDNKNNKIYVTKDRGNWVQV